MNNNLIQMKPRYVQNIINKFCYSIGMIPTSYKMALTYEEQILAIGQYLETTVYPAINNNAEALQEIQNLYIELKNYVDNYFNNLNVQQEINNKLDEMAQHETLAEIINQEVFSDINNKINNNFNLTKAINYNNNIVSYAWRGLTSEAPENSLASIIKAGKHNCYGVEIDIQVTSDGEIIFMHDTTIDRTTNGTGVVNELTYPYIASCHIDNGKNAEYFEEDKLVIPRLSDFAYLFRIFNLHLILDLKGSWNSTSLQNLLDILELNDLLDYTIIQAFNTNYLSTIRSLNNIIKLYFITEQEPAENDIDFCKSIYPSGINIAFMGDNYIIPQSIRLALIRNHIDFGFSVVETLTAIRHHTKHNTGIKFLISNYGIPYNNTGFINKNLTGIINETEIVPWYQYDDNTNHFPDNSKALHSFGFTFSNVSTNLYRITYDTPLFTRYNEYNGFITASIYSSTPDNLNKYKCIISNLQDTGFNLRFLDTSTNEFVELETVYADLPNARISFLVSGNTI